MSKRADELDKNLAVKAFAAEDNLLWLVASDQRLTMRGLAWYQENKRRFNRLPLRAEKIVRDAVWTLARCPSSARLCFRSDTSDFSVRVTNAQYLPMPHMPETGHSGLALYGGKPYRMRPWGFAIPPSGQAEYGAKLMDKLPRAMREYTLYLPLYNYLEKLEIGLSQGAKILPPSPCAVKKPVVFYGTSITQGGCASTAGSDYVSAIGRLLNLDVINLGFSGNGCGEPEMARIISEIDASLIVLDYVANVGPAQLAQTLPPFHHILRQRHPKTPILLLSQPCFSRLSYSSSARADREQGRDIMIHFYSKTRSAGDANLHFADGSALIPFGVDGAYVDGVHPTDHGFRMMAERLAPTLEIILNL